MVYTIFLAYITTAIVIGATSFAIYSTRIIRAGLRKDQDGGELNDEAATPEALRLSQRLQVALPESVILPCDAATFKQSMTSYWARQEWENQPTCVVRPRNVTELCTAVRLLKHEFDEKKSLGDGHTGRQLFAIRSGGHSPVPMAASIKAGVLIDLQLFSEVSPSDDGSSVTIGAGAKWGHVYKVLDERGLAVVGGRNSAVGVAGLTLGGGLSFFSPQFGLTCSNIISYEIVLASGTVVKASESTNSDLWRALKGGANNFGIVTTFVARSFPSAKIWSGFLYMPAFQASRVLSAFHDYVSRTDSSDPHTSYDCHAAGPIVSFSYIYDVGFQIIAVNLVHTKPPGNGSKWPACWQRSSFSSLWRIWNTCKVRTLSSATEELSALNPSGRRQVFGTVTVKNDLPTIAAAHDAYTSAITLLRRAKIKELVWTIVFQPLLPSWVRKGEPNPLGLHDGDDQAHVIVSFTVNWAKAQDDEMVKSTTRQTLERIEAYAAANGTSHPWRYLNYCTEWQRPFDGYGKDNVRFLKSVSQKFDPDGLFQRGCVGGFKLDAY